MIITIDGPAGAGKSTTAKGLAQRLGFEFLDTGSMYRAVAWAALSRGLKLQDEVGVGAVATGMMLEWRGTQLFCNDTDVTAAIRQPEVSAGASVVAANPEVRKAMVRLQREAAMGRNIVTEGRDQGSVVFPDAECKFYLTADPTKRAERRLRELEERGHPSTLDRVLAEIYDRDHRDKTRAISPLVKATDAIEVDTSGYSQDEVVDRLEEIAREVLKVR